MILSTCPALTTRWYRKRKPVTAIWDVAKVSSCLSLLQSSLITQQRPSPLCHPSAPDKLFLFSLTDAQGYVMQKSEHLLINARSDFELKRGLKLRATSCSFTLRKVDRPSMSNTKTIPSSRSHFYYNHIVGFCTQFTSLLFAFMVSNNSNNLSALAGFEYFAFAGFVCVRKRSWLQVKSSLHQI